MKFKRPDLRTAEKRRREIEDVLRTREIFTVDQLHALMKEEYGHDVHVETIRTDLRQVGAMKDARTDQYVLSDTQISRYDIYEMLRHALTFLLNNMTINKAQDTIFLYPDIGTAARFQYFLEAIRQDEQLHARHQTFRDNILGVVSSDDVVVIHMADSQSGLKFYKKLQVLSKQKTELDWVESTEEKTLMMRTMNSKEEE